MSSEGELISTPIHKWSGKTKVQGFVLVLFQFLVGFTPSEAYIVPFLIRVKHFTNEQILIDIFPYGIYFQLLFTLLAAPACHYFTHKTFIVMGTFSKLATFVIQYYAPPGSLLLMQLTQITYGLGMTTNLVFASYIFVISSEQDYQLMTSYTQAASLASFLVASELGQFLVDGGVSLVLLLRITLAFVALACWMSFLLPGDVSGKKETLLGLEQHSEFRGIGGLIRQTWQGRSLRLLSFWWVFGTAGFMMILNYGTSLFDKIDSTSNSYGHIVAASQGAGSLGALAGVKLAPFAAQRGGLVYVIGTATSGLCCLIMGWSATLWVAYPAYVTAIGISQLLLCLIYVQCAKCLSNREFILLFSFNAVAALLVQSTIQAVVEFLQMLIQDQFFVYGGYCLALALVFWFLCHDNYLKTGRVEIVPSTEESTPLI
ncbi:unnamed protein product [Calypogeia fissa]